MALDTDNICKSGDTVLIERLAGARETAESLSLKDEAVKEFWKPGSSLTINQRKFSEDLNNQNVWYLSSVSTFCVRKN